MKYHVETIISEKEIAKRISEMGKSISRHYKNKKSKVILVGLLNGSFIFIADLCRTISISHEIDFMIISSYGNKMNTSKKVKVFKGLDKRIKGKDILIVEDIIDSGNTLNRIHKNIKIYCPKSLSTCTLLNKPSRRKIKMPIEWIGFTIPNEFVVGYGIDYAQKYRHLPYIGKIVTK